MPDTEGEREGGDFINYLTYFIMPKEYRTFLQEHKNARK
jgi:hypothetical protein